MKKYFTSLALTLIATIALADSQDRYSSRCTNPEGESLFINTVMVGVVGSYLASNRIRIMCTPSAAAL